MHDTFQRVFQIIDPKETERSFISWVESIAVKTNGEIVSIDGKTLRGSKNGETVAIHMISAWANANQLVLGQINCFDTPPKMSLARKRRKCRYDIDFMTDVLLSSVL